MARHKKERPPPHLLTPRSERVGAERHRHCPGLWRREITLGYAEDGTRRRRKVRGQTKAAVVDKLRELHKALDKGIVPKTGYAHYTVRQAPRSSPGSPSRPAPRRVPAHALRVGRAARQAADRRRRPDRSHEDTLSVSVVCPDRWLPGDVAVVTSRDGPRGRRPG